METRKIPASLLHKFWFLVLFAAITGMADGLWVIAKNHVYVKDLSSVGIAAVRSIKTGWTGTPVLPHRIFLVQAAGDVCRFLVHVFFAWLILWLAAAAGYFLVSVLSGRIDKKGVHAVSGPAEYALTTAAGLTGLFAGLIGGALYAGSFSPWFWAAGLLAGGFCGFIVFRHLPAWFRKLISFVFAGMDRAARITGPALVLLVAAAGTGLHLHAWSIPDRVTGPSLIVFVVDTLREDALGICGSDSACSDRIDRFFRDGLQITGIRSDSSWTAPSFASFFTGLSPFEHGVVEGGIAFRPEHDTLAGVLKKHGFWCAALMCNPLVPADMGFDKGFDLYDNRITEWKAGPALHMCLSMIPVLKRQKQYFLLVQFMDCHNPYTPDVLYDGRLSIPGYDGRLASHSIPWEYKDPGHSYDPGILNNLRGLYQAALRDVDRAVEEILNAYGAAGLLDNTVIVLTSDHGEEFREHGSLDHCVTLYEETVRIPVLIKGGSSQPGLMRGTGHLSDLGRTLLNALGIPEPLGGGRCLITEDHSGRAVLLETRRHGYGIGAVVMNGFKYIAPVKPVDRQPVLEHYYPRPWHGCEVYDLEADPREQQPLAVSGEREQAFRRIWQAMVLDADARPAENVFLSDETREALKILGYIQ